MTLTPHDAAVAARDPGLPGLALLLDADRLAEVLAELLPDAGLMELEPSYLRYKPGTSCLAGFTVETTGGRVDFAAKAYKPRRYAVERARPVPEGLRSAVGPVALYLDEPAVLIRLVPYDRDLRALPRLVDPDRRRALLAKLVPDLVGCDWRLLRHKPGRRHIGVLHTAGCTRAIVKLYTQSHFEQARRGARFAAGNGGPALLGSSSRRGILVSAWQPGRNLADLGPEDPLVAPATAAAGAALAMVHDRRPAHLPQRTLVDESRAVTATAESLARLAPDLAERALGLAARVATRILDRSERMVPLHGDFSADQVVVGAESVHLIDWDRAGTGPRAADLGSFVARLEADALAAGRTRPGAQIDALMDAYRSTAGRRPQAEGVWSAAALLRLASEPFRQRRPDWPDLAAALLDRAAWHVDRDAASTAEAPARRRLSA